jgi:antitoxin (DNA-binding transcriptional repressor) of toxin-antitoxin stability system
MRTVGLKVLKNKLSEYVRLAAQGETVLIADRDRVVAELVPPQPGRAETVSDAVLASLVREGLVTPALLPAGTRPNTPAPTLKLRDILNELDKDRGER